MIENGGTNIKCSIAKDLLSNYIDGLTCEETNEEIRKHLDDCDDCRIVYEKMAAVITNEDGTISLEDIDPAIYGTIVPEDSGHIIDAVRFAYHGINNIGESSSGRTINRNGQEVRVVYYCYTKTLWNSMFIDSDLLGYSESGSSYGSELYEDNYDSEDYEPQMKEIYYLPMRNLYKIRELPDEEFDKLREQCDLIWSGVI